MERGYIEGEVCGRDGCSGIIDELDIEGGCSCHMSPPCTYCTTPKGYCPECGWEDDREDDVPSDTPQEYNKWWKSPTESLAEFKKEYESGTLDRIRWVGMTHTHFTMIREGYCPKSMVDKLTATIRCTFGGRYVTCPNPDTGGYFKYIGYTD